MKLSELTPKEVVFTVSDVELTFRPFTIADDITTRNICGGQKKVQAAFEQFDFHLISLIGWNQLTLESQKEVVKAVEAVRLDPETGEEIIVNIKPIEKFRQLFAGVGDQILLVTKLVECKGFNIPDLEDEEMLGKWLDMVNIKLTGA